MKKKLMNFFRIILIVFSFLQNECGVTKLKPKCNNCKAYIGPQGAAGVDATSDNFLFISDSMPQGMGMSGVFQNVTFDTVSAINGWVPVSGDVEFTCNKTALYYISYSATVSNITTDEGTIEMVLQVNGLDVDQSRIVSGMANVNTPLVVSHSFLHTIQENQVIKLQIRASNDTIQLQANTGGTIAPSVSLTILRIK